VKHVTDILTIHTDETGLSAPQTAAPGRARFSASTTVDGSGWVGLARFKGTPDWPSFQAHLRDMVSDDQSRIRQGTPALHAQVTMLGGAVIHPDLPGDFTIDLPPGDYVFFDYPDTVASDSPRRQFMAVRGTEHAGRATGPSAVVRADCDDAGRPRFTVSGRLPAAQPVLFENAMAEPQFVEYVLLPIAEQVGEAELADYFAQFQDGSSDWPPDPPFDVTRGSGCLPLSPGRRALMTLPVGPGRYVLVNWLKSAETGVRMAKLGQWAVIEIG
jgi:hypothetical protein